MKKLALIITAAFIFAGVSNAMVVLGDDNTAAHTVGIDIENLAIINIESTGNGNSNDITMSPSAPTEAGEAVSFSGITNNKLWLNYSSIVSSGKTRSVSASISNDLPGGVSLKVAAGDVSQHGKGDKGDANNSAQILTSGGVDVITGIGSCYTGKGPNKGSNLTYTLDMDEDKYNELYQGAYSVTITYTITDEQ